MNIGKKRKIVSTYNKSFNFLKKNLINGLHGNNQFKRKIIQFLEYQVVADIIKKKLSYTNSYRIKNKANMK